MLSPSVWPGWVRVGLLIAAFFVAFVPYVGLLVSLALVAVAIIPFGRRLPFGTTIAAIREELRLGVGLDAG